MGISELFGQIKSIRESRKNMYIWGNSATTYNGNWFPDVKQSKYHDPFKSSQEKLRMKNGLRNTKHR